MEVDLYKNYIFLKYFCFTGMCNYFYYFTYSIYTITLYRSVKIFKFSRQINFLQNEIYNDYVQT